jgi:transposase-like protein
MMDDRQGVAGRLTGQVEIDEAFIGGKPKLRRGVLNKRGRGTSKPIALVAAARNGQARAAMLPNIQSLTMKPILEGWIDPTSVIITDKNSSYQKKGVSFANHLTVQHNTRQYANVKTGAHINMVEAVKRKGDRLVISGAPGIDPKNGEELVYRMEFTKV